MVFWLRFNTAKRTEDIAMYRPDDHDPAPSVTISQMISESVYQLVLLADRFLWWLDEAVIRPGRLIYWCLRW